MPPAVFWTFQGAAHGVVPQSAIRTRPNRTITVLIRADRTNKKSAAWRMVTSCVRVRACFGVPPPGRPAFVESPQILPLDHCHPVKDWHGTTAGHCLFQPINGGKLGRRERI